MIKSILGTKINQTQIFTEAGIRVPVTQIESGPCPIVQIRTEEKDGYMAIQLGFGQAKEKNINKPELGHLKLAGETRPRFLREIRVMDGEDIKDLKLGDMIKLADVLNVGDIVDVVGVSRGMGFQGGVKRWNFKGGPRTHGQSDRERAPGSVGTTTTPGRVLRGKRMAGHMGSANVTVRNLEVVNIDQEKNIVQIKGQVPGVRNSLVTIIKVKEGKKGNTNAATS